MYKFPTIKPIITPIFPTLESIPEINPLKAKVTTYVILTLAIRVKIRPITRPAAVPDTQPFFQPNIRTKISIKILNTENCKIITSLNIVRAIARTRIIEMLSSLENT